MPLGLGKESVMKGVNLGDLQDVLYLSTCKSIRWYWTIFFKLPDMSTINALIVCKALGNLTQFESQPGLIQELLLAAAGSRLCQTQAEKTTQKSDGYNHLIVTSRGE